MAADAGPTNGRAEPQAPRLLHQSRAFAARVQSARARAGEGSQGPAARATEIPLHLVDESRRVLRDPGRGSEATRRGQLRSGGPGQLEPGRGPEPERKCVVEG